MAEIFIHNDEAAVRLDRVDAVFPKSKRSDANPYSSHADPQVTNRARRYGLTVHLKQEGDSTRRNDGRIVHLNVDDAATEAQLFIAFVAEWEAGVADNADA